MDVLYIALIIAFFASCGALVYYFDKLAGRRS
jgi:hypothetical protein